MKSTLKNIDSSFILDQHLALEAYQACMTELNEKLEACLLKEGVCFDGSGLNISCLEVYLKQSDTTGLTTVYVMDKPVFVYSKVSSELIGSKITYSVHYSELNSVK